MNTPFTYKLSTDDIAHLLGKSKNTIKRDLKAARLDRACLPSMVHWLYLRQC